MRIFKRALTLSALALVVAAPSAMAAEPVMISLGDSWSAGAGASNPSTTSYVPLVFEGLKANFDCSPSPDPHPNQGCKKLELVPLGVGGATTPTMIAGQLPDAISLLNTRNHDDNLRNDVEVITIHIGGNDVTNPIISACVGVGFTPTCIGTIASELGTYAADLNSALSALRTAAGPGTRIVQGSYDNGFAQCFLGPIPGAIGLANIVLEGLPPFVPQGLHDIMQSVGSAYSVEFASVFGQLAPADWVGGADCLHPVDSGYAKVATSFLNVLAP